MIKKERGTGKIKSSLKKQPFVNEINIQYTRRNLQPKPLCSSLEVARVAKEIYEMLNCQMDVKEYFFVLMLNRRNYLTGFMKLSEGGITGTVADQRLIFAAALKSLACSIVLVHNHPSGNFLPSETDIKLTRKLISIGELMDIPVLDHVIITSGNSYYSFADSGLVGNRTK